MQPVTLDAEGLRLVGWEPRHLPVLQRIYEDPLVERFMVMPLPWERHHRERFLDLNARHWLAGNPRWAVEDAEGDLVGSIGLTNSFPKEVAITYLTAPWARDRGVAQRSVRAAVGFAFDKMRMHRVGWDAIVGNHASRLAAIRTGFTIEGFSRNGVHQRGAPRDCWFGGIVPGELRDAGHPPHGYRILKAQGLFFSGEQPVLETGTEGLRLRPLRESDLDDVVATCADEAAAAFTAVPRDYTRADAEAFFGEVGSRWDRGAGVYYALADDRDRYCGAVELVLRGPGDAEVGYIASPWARGRDWMTAAVKRLCRLGFEDLALKRIDWRAVVGDEASRRVAEKAGFAVEGVRRQVSRGSGERVDCWAGSLLPDGW